jgi:formamidopyrimidine-DNA glycosylase
MTQGRAGIDPLSEHFTVDTFEALVAEHPDRPVRALLLDHDVLAVVSPAHADAILAAAQLQADRLAGALSEPEVHRLYREIRDVLGRLVEGYHGYDS